MNNTSTFNVNPSSAFVHYSPSKNDENVLLPFFQHRKLVSPSSENTKFDICGNTRTPPNDITDASPDRAPLQSMLPLQIHPTAPIVFRRERSPTTEAFLKNHPDIKRARFGENHISPVQLFEKEQGVCTIDNDIMSLLSFEEEATQPAILLAGGYVAMVTPPSSPTKELLLGNKVPTHHRTTPPVMIDIIDDYEMLASHSNNHRNKNKQRRDRNHALCSSEFDPILDQVFAHVF
jgi:hypothetical protein